MKKGIFLRINEIALKSDRKQNFFVSAFTNSLESAFSRNGFSVTIEQFGHSILISHDTPEKLLPTLRCVPGVELFAVTTSFQFATYEDILDSVVDVAKEKISGKTFRVTARRFGGHEFSSMQLAAKLGERLMDFSAGVDLHSPEITIFVEVRNKRCFVHTKWEKGLGGMPAGSAGKGVILFSGGIDCPVAMYQALRKGCFLDALFVNMVGESVKNEVFSVYNYVIDKYAFTHTPKLFEIDGTSIPKYLQEHVPNTLRQQALKIIFYKLAKAIAQKTSAWGVFTGESLSQKSTQTIQSLDLIQHFASPILVLRPLITYDKIEIISLAREIGTFAASELVKEQCNISSGKVTAVPHPKDFEKIPDLDPFVNELLEKITTYSGIILLEKSLSTTAVSLSKDCVVVDIRTPSMRESKPIPCDQEHTFPDILDSLQDFSDKEKTYVFVCQFGVLGKEVAHHLKKKGLKAVGLSVSEFEHMVA